MWFWHCNYQCAKDSHHLHSLLHVHPIFVLLSCSIVPTLIAFAIWRSQGNHLLAPKACLFIWHCFQGAKPLSFSHLPAAPPPSMFPRKRKSWMIQLLIFSRNNGLGLTLLALKFQTLKTLTVFLSLKKLWMMTIFLHHLMMILFYPMKNHWLMTMLLIMSLNSSMLLKHHSQMTHHVQVAILLSLRAKNVLHP